MLADNDYARGGIDLELLPIPRYQRAFVGVHDVRPDLCVVRHARRQRQGSELCLEDHCASAAADSKHQLIDQLLFRFSVPRIVGRSDLIFVQPYLVAKP
jgi:hypothetical protein